MKHRILNRFGIRINTGGIPQRGILGILKRILDIQFFVGTLPRKRGILKRFGIRISLGGIPPGDFVVKIIEF